PAHDTFRRSRGRRDVSDGATPLTHGKTDRGTLRSRLLWSGKIWHVDGPLAVLGCWCGMPFEETSRRPRGLPGISAAGWERLYALRPPATWSLTRQRPIGTP